MKRAERFARERFAKERFAKERDLPEEKENTVTQSKRMSRKERQELMTKKRRNQNILVYGGGAVAALLLIYVIYLGVRPTQPVGQEKILATQGNTHIVDDSRSPLAYNSTPPTSGPHYSGIAPWGSYAQPFPYERVLHNLEDAGVAIYYQCADGCSDLVAQLDAVVQSYLSQGKRVVLVPNDPTWSNGGPTPWHQDMGSRIALTAWQRIDKFDDFDAERIRQFIDAYEGIDHHVGSNG